MIERKISEKQLQELKELHFLWIFAHSTVVGYVCKAGRSFLSDAFCNKNPMQLWRISEFYQDFLIIYAFLLRQFYGKILDGSSHRRLV